MTTNLQNKITHLGEHNFQEGIKVGSNVIINDTVGFQVDEFTIGHIKSATNVPTFAVLPNLTNTLTNCSDLCGKVNVHNDNINDVTELIQILSVTFATPYTVAPIVIISPNNSNFFLLDIFVDSTSTTGFSVSLDGNLQVGDNYTISYLVIEPK